MKAGDLVRLCTPDGDNGKLALIVAGDTMNCRRPEETDAQSADMQAVIVGETEIKYFLPWEFEYIKETFISQ